VTIRVRLGHGIARLAPAPFLTLDVAPPATVADACERLADAHPDLAPALGSVLTVVGGSQVARTHELRAGDELALLMPTPGG
jgi:molybdopterin synthase catalytic subunit/molybdopterin synthase sulfur carrier subunit